jgi:WhiB family redox-sensing transcriptional regulator
VNPNLPWQRYALCAETDPDLFYADRGTTQERAAVAICQTCPVLQECLAEVLAEEGGRGKEARYGIRAGLTPGQRYWAYERARRNARGEVAA